MSPFRPPTRPIRATVLPAALLALLVAVPAGAQDASRARDLGVPFDGRTGPLNAITDVGGVEVGHTTLVSGDGPLVVGQGPVRTGVTAILPRGRASYEPVFAAWHPLNGNGEMTGTAWIEESGLLTSPVLITNTHSVGMVHHATLEWMVDNQPGFLWALPVVAETWDGVLNDINGFHVRPEHVVAALEGARGGPVEEGAVGGGTGMICNGFKGGIGTASRVVGDEEGEHTVGVLVQCNYGSQRGLLVAGVPVGRELLDEGLQGRCLDTDREPSRPFLRGLPGCDETGGGDSDEGGLGSIIIVVATDAPLLPHQLERLVRRATLGLGRVGSIAGNGSGDLFLAFSTAGDAAAAGRGGPGRERVPNGELDPLFRATVEATEEAVVNAMVAARTMVGADDVRVRSLPHDRLREALAAHGRLLPPDTR